MGCMFRTSVISALSLLFVIISGLPQEIKSSSTKRSGPNTDKFRPNMQLPCFSWRPPFVGRVPDGFQLLEQDRIRVATSHLRSRNNERSRRMRVVGDRSVPPQQSSRLRAKLTKDNLSQNEGAVAIGSFQLTKY